jgi:hypothetical protein
MIPVMIYNVCGYNAVQMRSKSDLWFTIKLTRRNYRVSRYVTLHYHPTHYIHRNS